MLAAVLLGTGPLAMSGMQTIALVKNVDANELARITTLTSDMMERVQFNRRNAVSYNGIDTQSATDTNASVPRRSRKRRETVCSGTVSWMAPSSKMPKARSRCPT